MTQVKNVHRTIKTASNHQNRNPGFFALACFLNMELYMLDSVRFARLSCRLVHPGNL